MLKALFLALNVKPGEEKQVLLLLGNGFFLGVFLATYQVTAETLFLNRLGEYLQEAILVSGFLGIITTVLFANLQERIPFNKLALGNLVSILLFISLAYWSYRHLDAAYQDYLVFVLFVMMGPILAISLLGFWGVFGRLFDLRQSKRIISRIDMGQLLAAIITSFSIPFLETFIPDTFNFLLISAISVLLSFVFLFLITYNYDLKQAEISESEEAVQKTGFGDLLKNKYIQLMSLFLLFSMITFTFIQFSFQNVVSEQYADESELRNFLAVFNGSILVLGLLLQTFINDKIINQYGLKVSLFILPIILAIFTAGAIVSGNIFGFSTAAGASFIWFFLFIALSRLFNYSIRDSLENPTFKLYFMPLDNRVRFNIQTKVEGVVNQIAIFISGVLMVGLSLFNFFELIHYSYAIILLIVGYVFIIGKMYNEYRNHIKIKLESQQKMSEETSATQDEQLRSSLTEALFDEKMNRVVFSFKLLEKVEPLLIPNHINTLMKHHSPEIKEFAQTKMNELKGMSVSDKYVISVREKEILKSKYLINQSDLLGLFESGDISQSRVYHLSRSANKEDRQYAAELLSNGSHDENTSYLIELLHDADPKVRNTAINAVQKKNNSEVLNAIIDNLQYPEYSVQAMNTLVLIGGKSLSALDTAFYKSGQSVAVMLKIIQVMGRIGGNKAKEQLWHKIDFPDKVLISQVLLSLGHCGFKAGISQIPRIKYAIESDIEDMAWNIGAMNEVTDNYFGKQIKKALEEEIKYDTAHIYMLLSMLYDSHSIQLVKENIESRTNEGIIYAIELLDVFLSDDLKQRIIPVLDDLPYSEKTKKLEIFYPRNKLDEKQVLKFLLNRDFSQTNRWTKTCILRQIGLMKINDYNLDVIANLFNPDMMVREEAAWALHEIDPLSYKENVSRLNYSVKNHLDELILRKSDRKRLSHFEKVIFLLQIPVFSDVYGLVVAGIVDFIEEINLPAGEMLVLDDNYEENFYIVHNGLVNIYENGIIKGGTREGEFIGELMRPLHSGKFNHIVAVEDTLLFKISKNNMYDLLVDNVDLAQKMIEYA